MAISNELAVSQALVQAEHADDALHVAQAVVQVEFGTLKVLVSQVVVQVEFGAPDQEPMYIITLQPDGSINLDFGPGDDLFNSVVLSLEIRKGSWWLDPEFGLAVRPRMKNSAKTARLFEADLRAALQWLITAKRATAVVIATERELPSRLKAFIEVTGADGRTVPYTKFIEVV
jgi:phage gp46-like protein